MRLFLFALLLPVLTSAATITLNELTTTQANPLRIGINNAAATNYDQGQFCKNWLCINNPAFQGINSMQTVPVTTGTTGGFTGQNIYDQIIVNSWAGATWRGLVSPSSSGAQSESGTLSANTVSNYATSSPPTYTFSSTVGTAPVKGDWMAIEQLAGLSTSGICPASSPNYQTCIPIWTATLASGGTTSAESSDLPSGTYDAQALLVDTTAAGASASVQSGVDQTYTSKGGNFLPFWSGTSYTFSIKCKTVSGSGVVSFSVERLSTGGQSATGTATCTNSWTTIGITFTGTENGSTSIGTIIYSLSFAQGHQYQVVDSYLGQTTYSGSNPTVYTDTYVAALKAYAGDSLRLWDNQVGDSFDDLINPQWGRHNQTWAQNGNLGSAYTFASGVYDHLRLCEVVGVNTCWVVIPAAWPDSDYQHIIEFLAGTSGTYPTKRNALDALYGRTNGPFTSSIPQIVLELTDEPWNDGNAGEYMADLGDGYGMDGYGLMAKRAFTLMKADAAFVSNIKLAVNAQTCVNCAFYMQNYILTNVTNADVVSLNGYVYETLNSLSTLNQEYDPQSGFAYSTANDATNGPIANEITAITGTFPSYPLTFMLYEGGQATQIGSATTAQIVTHNTGMIGAPEVIQAFLESMKHFGTTVENIFTSTEDFTSPGQNPIWGLFKDANGGQLAGQGNYYFRQVGLAAQIANQCIGVGSTMYGATVTAGTTYSTAALNGWPAWTSLPYLTAYAFKNGSNRCLVIVNSDPVNTATVSFAGTPPTSGTIKYLSSASAAANNETATPGATIATGSYSGGTYTMPAYSVTALSWTSGSAGVIAVCAGPCGMLR